MRDEVTYFYYLSQGSPEHVERECAAGVRRGYTCLYLQVGIDSAAETQMLAAIRRTIGPERKIRIDANEAWSVPVAARLLTAWKEAYTIDFCEAHVPIRSRACRRYAGGCPSRSARTRA
jgi:L-alanine-DL-glutamate epimerase-like enolase superfamily enzyme